MCTSLRRLTGARRAAILGPMTSNQPDTTDITEDRSFRAFHTFMRASRSYMEGPVYESAFRAYNDTLDGKSAPANGAPSNADEALGVLDGMPSYQLYGWMYRHLQRFKYRYADWGLVPKVQAARETLEAELNAAAETAQKAGTLRLDPDIAYPDYYRLVDFHQHPGGVWSDELDGIIYELGRRTTLPLHMDSNDLYRLMFTYLPQDRTYERVLDWGVGHGGMLLSWLETHPKCEAHGIDISAPCLKLANKRAQEQGVTLHLSQQEIGALDYPDNHFDLVMFCFMLHEIPPKPTRPALEEVYRVLKPGGIYAGIEFLPQKDNPFQNAMLLTSVWANNEPFAPASFEYPYLEVARKIGFSKAEIVPFDKLQRTQPGTLDGAKDRPPFSFWPIYMFEK